MKKRFISYFLWLLPMTSAAQTVNNRGAIVTADPTVNAGNTYAVVIGISKYKEVTPLNYADRDAEVFADYLLNKQGMGLDSGNVKLFLNESATINNIGNALSDIIIKNLKKGDRIIFFFAGHGDYDANILKDQALLLLHGAPKQNYFQNIFSGDFISTADLNSRFIDPLSAKGCEVILLIDACHANGMDKQLSGGTEGGRVTALALQNMTAPVKIYSCKSNQYSLESKQWGGGRGLFSYILMEGLYGMADADNNNTISFKEIQRYLEDNIPKLAAPDKQYPIIKINDPEEVIAKVNQDLLAAYKQEKNKNLVFLAKADTKGGSEPWVLEMDSTQKVLYLKCDSLINKKETVAAYKTFLLFATADSTSEASLRLRRNLSAAMQERAAAILMPMLKENNKLVKYFNTADSTELIKAVNDLEIAATLLGEKHFLYRNLVARILFLRSLVLENNEGISCLELSLVLEPNAPYTCYYLAKRYQYKNYLEKAKLYYGKYIELMPKSKVACKQIANIFFQMGEYNESIKYHKKLLELHPGFIESYQYIGASYYVLKEYDKAINMNKKVLELNPADPLQNYNLVCLYCLKKDKPAALHYFEQYLKMKITDLSGIEADPDLNYIRNTAEFRSILQKYFTQEALAKYPGIYKPALNPLTQYQLWPSFKNNLAADSKKDNSGQVKDGGLRKVMYVSADSLVIGSLENIDGNMEGNRWTEWNTQPGVRGYNFIETGRDEWTVSLTDSTNSNLVKIDLKKNIISKEIMGTNRKEVYAITRKEEKNNFAAVVFDNKDYKGESLEVGGDIDWIGEHWNDRISSIHVNKGYKLQVFYDIHYGKKYLVIEGDWNAPEDWDNRISSIKVLRK